ncbi:MAG: cytochrome c oxidase subunit II [Chloroflexi bacterium]|nr:cytochrome c oxidase subunit II [Chloroflexota bacterium]
MKRNLNHSWILMAASGVLLIALAFPVQALAHGPADGGADSDTIDDLFLITLIIAIPIFVLVEGLIIYAIIRYRRRQADEIPEQVHGNPPLEIAWTVISFLIIGVLFVLTVRVLNTGYEADAENDEGTPDYVIEVIGYMWNWDFKYYVGDSDQPGVRTPPGTMRIPAERAVLLEITSTDVQHSFWLPDLAGKVDAIPGYTNTMWLQLGSDQVGETYIGNCAEYCGTLHFDMLIEAEVMDPDEFDTWLAQEEARLGDFIPVGTDLDTPLPFDTADPDRGEEAYNSYCIGCHGAEDGVGPALTGMWDRAATRRDGYSAERYLREAIVDPCAYEVDGYSCTLMPDNYGEQMDAQKLADIIEYIRQQD